MVKVSFQELKLATVNGCIKNCNKKLRQLIKFLGVANNVEEYEYGNMENNMKVMIPKRIVGHPSYDIFF